MSGRPERYVALPSGEPDFDSFACRFSGLVSRLMGQIRDQIEVALKRRCFDDQCVTVILMTVVKRGLVDEQRFFGQLGVEWYERYNGSLEELIRAWGEDDVFLSHTDRREELIRAIHQTFQV